jgi:hypothetical protein
VGNTVRYQSSRFSRGNRIFPDRIEVGKDAVVFHKRRFVGGEEESIRYEQIASVSIQRGFFLADMLFETTGGSEPVFLNGLWIGAAERCRADVQARIRTNTTSKEDKVVTLLEEQNRLLGSILRTLQKA